MRWAIFLMSYQYNIVHRSTYNHSNADCLSRLPNTEVKCELDLDFRAVNVMQIESLHVHFQKVARTDLEFCISAKLFDQ